MAPADLYSSRLADRTRTSQALDAESARLAQGRLLVFVAAAVGFYFTLQGSIDWKLLFIPLTLFFILVSMQARVDRRKRLADRAIRFFSRALARLNNTWQGSNSTGERFLDPHHPYAVDLDLFGPSSLFEFVSAARTKGGEARLADWFLSPAPALEIMARQQAIDELRSLLDWREELAVLGEDYTTHASPETLTNWAAQQATPFSPATRITALILSIAGLAAIAWWFSTSFVGLPSRFTLVGVGVLEGLFALQFRTQIRRIIDGIDQPAADLELMADLIASIEARSFATPRLQELRSRFDISGEPVSRRLKRLRRLKELIDSRDNAAVRAFGPLVLWTTQTAMAIENWRAANAQYIPGWLDALSDFEALRSLAGYAFENPRDPFPVIVTGAPLFDAVDLAHPLLPTQRAVANSLHFADPVRLYLVSGSNMSGKSTMLRSVGINMVLALAGAPVRATSLTLSLVSLGASIRTTDSLQEGHSRFMAEILRLKQILDLPAPAFFLLDELLHGTNSHDRAIGSEGLVRALLARGAIGMITTHDLSLSRLAEELEPAACNVHFEDRLENGQLVFDYRMRPGVVTRSNALDLMRSAGLDI